MSSAATCLQWPPLLEAKAGQVQLDVKPFGVSWSVTRTGRRRCRGRCRVPPHPRSRCFRPRAGARSRSRGDTRARRAGAAARSLSVESASVNGEAKDMTHARGVPFPLLGLVGGFRPGPPGRQEPGRAYRGSGRRRKRRPRPRLEARGSAQWCGEDALHPREPSSEVRSTRSSISQPLRPGPAGKMRTFLPVARRHGIAACGLLRELPARTPSKLQERPLQTLARALALVGALVGLVGALAVCGGCAAEVYPPTVGGYRRSTPAASRPTWPCIRASRTRAATRTSSTTAGTTPMGTAGSCCSASRRSSTVTGSTSLPALRKSTRVLKAGRTRMGVSFYSRATASMETLSGYQFFQFLYNSLPTVMFS